jgi:predicted glycosyltransferase involved in capsule biosynthesis
MKKDLKDKLTLIIPVQVDHEDRVRNIRTTLSYIKHHFDVNIIISEQDTSSKLHDMCKEFKCRHIYNKTDDFFNKLKLVNIAAKEVNTPVISIYDADALVRPEQLEGATNAIVSGSAQMVYPYDGKFYDVPVRFFDNINETKDLTNINLEECTLFNSHSVGGIVMFDREHFWKCGGGNENFKSVGYDDNEIDIRFRILGTKIMRTQWPLFHLNHTRVETSFNHNPHINFNRDYCMKITNMNRAQLLEHVDQWDWHKNNI